MTGVVMNHNESAPGRAAPCRRCAAIRLVLVCVTLVLLAALFASVARAEEGSWWKRGAEIFKEVATPQVSGSASASGSLATADLVAGLREALQVGTGRVVDQLGQAGGFSQDPAIRIPLPESMQTVRKALGTVGMDGMLTDLEARLNVAAEQATPKAKELFLDAITDMKLEDAQQIYSGPADAATRYFQERMSGPLAAEMQPVISEALSQAGAVQMYDQVMGQYGQLPFVPDVKADLQAHVTQKGMDGIFHYLAQEEAAIRQDPARRTTELLQKVFGAN